MPDFSQLTDRQREIYEFIREKIEGRGYGPTVREIGVAFDIKSPNGVMCHLKALEKKGLLIRDAGKARAIMLAGHKPPDRGLPLLGNVAAGPPTEAVEALPRAYQNGKDLDARGKMLVAAAMGAVAFQKDLGVVHSILSF